MVELIGLTTLVALVWLLAFGMKTESDAERRRLSTGSHPLANRQKSPDSGTKHAA